MITTDRTPRTSQTTSRVVTAAVTAAMFSLAGPAVAVAQEEPASGSTGSVNVEGLVSGLVPEDIVVGGPELGAGSDGLRDMGSSGSADAAVPAGQVLGSVAPLAALGSTGGSATTSVASSGSLPGSVYANPTGSIGSGVIGLGSVSLPEYALGSLALQVAGGYVSVLAERQEAGELDDDELRFWHGVVVGSAEAGATLEDIAEGTGSGLPGSLGGSIDSVQRAALEDPLAPGAGVESDDEPAGTRGAAGAVGDTGDGGAAGTAEGTDAGDMPAVDTDPAAPDLAVLAATAGSAATDHTATGRESGRAAPGLAATGSEVGATAGMAAASLILGGLLLFATARRRA